MLTGMIRSIKNYFNPIPFNVFITFETSLNGKKMAMIETTNGENCIPNGDIFGNNGYTNILCIEEANNIDNIKNKAWEYAQQAHHRHNQMKDWKHSKETLIKS